MPLLEKSKLAESGIPPVFWESKFSRMSLSDDCMDQINKYVSDFNSLVSSGIGAMFSCPEPSTASACLAIMGKLAMVRGKKVMLAPETDLVDAMFRTFGGKESPDWDRAMSVDCLMIDEVFPPTPSGAVQRVNALTNIVQKRFRARKPIYLATPLPLTGAESFPMIYGEELFNRLSAQMLVLEV